MLGMTLATLGLPFCEDEWADPGLVSDLACFGMTWLISFEGEVDFDVWRTFAVPERPVYDNHELRKDS